jgi:hypothetical protein
MAQSYEKKLISRFSLFFFFVSLQPPTDNLKSMRILKERTLLVFVAIILSANSFAQSDLSASVSADLVSQYMWRGRELGGISIQPTATVDWKGLSLTLFGNVGFESTDDKEIDLTLGYEYSGFNIGVTDYWLSGIDPNNRYFFFEKQGAHQLEANIGYKCKYFSLQAYTFVWGNDFRISGKQAYSTYIELGVPFEMGGINWQLTAGMTPFESAGYLEEKEHQGLLGVDTYYARNFFYAEGAACVMASIRATKDLDLGFSKIPVFAEFHTNPYLQTANVLFGITINPF